MAISRSCINKPHVAQTIEPALQTKCASRVRKVTGNAYLDQYSSAAVPRLKQVTASIDHDWPRADRVVSPTLALRRRTSVMLEKAQRDQSPLVLRIPLKSIWHPNHQTEPKLRSGVWTN